MLRRILCLVLVVSAGGAAAATISPDSLEAIQRNLARQLLSEVPEERPTGCVGASLAFNTVLPILEAVGFSERSPVYTDVLRAVDDYVLGTEDDTRPYLAVLLTTSAAIHLRYGDVRKAYDLCAIVHDSVMRLHPGIEKLMPELAGEGEWAVDPEEGCSLVFGVAVVHFSVAQCLGLVRDFPQSTLSEEQRAHLREMREDLESLEPVYDEWFAITRRSMGSK